MKLVAMHTRQVRRSGLGAGYTTEQGGAGAGLEMSGRSLGRRYIC